MSVFSLPRLGLLTGKLWLMIIWREVIYGIPQNVTVLRSFLWRHLASLEKKLLLVFGNYTSGCWHFICWQALEGLDYSVHRPLSVPLIAPHDLCLLWGILNAEFLCLVNQFLFYLSTFIFLKCITISCLRKCIFFKFSWYLGVYTCFISLPSF